VSSSSRLWWIALGPPVALFVLLEICARSRASEAPRVDEPVVGHLQRAPDGKADPLALLARHGMEVVQTRELGPSDPLPESARELLRACEARSPRLLEYEISGKAHRVPGAMREFAAEHSGMVLLGVSLQSGEDYETARARLLVWI
jgi:hypothetical protein